GARMRVTLQGVDARGIGYDRQVGSGVAPAQHDCRRRRRRVGYQWAGVRGEKYDLRHHGCFFFAGRRRHARLVSDWSSDVCSSDLGSVQAGLREVGGSAASGDVRARPCGVDALEEAAGAGIEGSPRGRRRRSRARRVSEAGRSLLQGARREEETMSFAQPLSWWAAALVAAAVAAIASAAYRRPLAPLSPRRRALLAALRVCALGALVLFLLRPIVLVPPAAGNGAIVPVIVD